MIRGALVTFEVFFVGGQDEEDGDVYEIIETPGSRNLVEQLISMDLAERPAVQQITIGGISGWWVEHIERTFSEPSSAGWTPSHHL